MSARCVVVISVSAHRIDVMVERCDGRDGHSASCLLCLRWIEHEEATMLWGSFSSSLPRLFAMMDCISRVRLGKLKLFDKEGRSDVVSGGSHM